MTDDVGAIAAGLTKAQRHAIHRLDGEWRFLGLASRPDKCHPVIERWNRPYGGFNYRLTPLGLAVRAHLLASQTSGEGG